MLDSSPKKNRQQKRPLQTGASPQGLFATKFIMVFYPTPDKNSNTIHPFKQVDVVLSSACIERLGGAYVLYSLARSSDGYGRGWGYIDLKLAQLFLNRTRQTILRYMKKATRLGLFHKVVRDVEGWQVQYLALHKVPYLIDTKLPKQRKGNEELITKLSSCFRIAVDDIWAGSLAQAKHLGVEAAVEAAEKSSIYASEMAQREKGRKAKRPSTASIRNKLAKQCSEANRKQPSPKSRGAVMHVGPRYAFVEQHFVRFGASQDYVAKLVGRCRSTIVRRLSPTSRAKVGLPHLWRRQLAIKENVSRLAVKQMKQAITESMGEKPFDSDQFICSGHLFKASTNVYECAVELTSQKYSKWKANKYRQSMLNQSVDEETSIDSCMHPAQSPESSE